MKERLVGRHLLGPIVGLIVALLVPAGISSTAAAGPVVPSDAGEITRTYGVDYWTAKSAELRLATARPAEIDRSTANTPAVGERAGLQLVVERFAPSSAPPIKPGAVDGPTSVKPFGQRVKDDVVAENLEVTGGDVLVPDGYAESAYRSRGTEVARRERDVVERSGVVSALQHVEGERAESGDASCRLRGTVAAAVVA